MISLRHLLKEKILKVLGYLGFTATFFGIMFIISSLFGHSEPHTLTEDAVEPDRYLQNSRVYAQEHAFGRSIEHLTKAIVAIRNIEQEIDPESQKTVDKAVAQLERVRREIEADTLDFTEMNRAFISALNALTYAEIKVTEQYLESHDVDRAQVALKYGMVHIKNALKYTQGEKRAYEIHLYAELDSITKSKNLSNDEIIARLEHVLSELDTAITAQ